MHDPNSDPIASAIDDILRGPEAAQADQIMQVVMAARAGDPKARMILAQMIGPPQQQPGMPPQMQQLPQGMPQAPGLEGQQPMMGG